MIFERIPDRLEIHWGDVQECLADIPEATVQTVVTSPPYFDVRDYGTAEWDGGDPACKHGIEEVGETVSQRGGSKIHSTRRIGSQRARYRNRCGICGAVRLDTQVGIEDSIDGYASRLVEIFEDVARVPSP